jgi:hypothetical protein
VNAPKKGESPLAGGLIAKENTNSSSNSTVAEQKLCAAVIARLALVGFAVHPPAMGGFLIMNSTQSRYCADLRSLADFANQVEERE